MSILSKLAANGLVRRPNRIKPTASKPGEIFPVVDLGCGLTAQLTWITKPIADNLLRRRNKELQRSIKKLHKAAMKVDLEAGRWLLNGETVVLDWNDELVDGQHRCEIVSETGLPILTVVIRGVDPECYMTIDGGAKRSGGDTLRHQGYASAVALSGAAHLLWKYEKGLLTSHIPISASTADEVVSRHPMLAHSVEFTSNCRRICQSASMAGFCHYVFSRIDEPAADMFFTKLATGEDLRRGHPVLALRSRLLPVHLDRLPDRRVVLPMTIKAWNALRQGKKLGLIKFTAQEKFPEIV